MDTKPEFSQIKKEVEKRAERIADALAIMEKWEAHQIIIVTVDWKSREIAAASYAVNKVQSEHAAALGKLCLETVMANFEKTIPADHSRN